MERLPVEVVEQIAAHVDNRLLFRFIQLVARDSRFRHVYDHLCRRHYTIKIDKDPENCKLLTQLDDVMPHLQRVTMVPQHTYGHPRLNQGIINDYIETFPEKSIAIEFPCVSGGFGKVFDHVVNTKLDDALLRWLPKLRNLVQLDLELETPHLAVRLADTQIKQLRVLLWNQCRVELPALLEVMTLLYGAFELVLPEPNCIRRLGFHYVKLLEWPVKAFPRIEQLYLGNYGDSRGTLAQLHQTAGTETSQVTHLRVHLLCGPIDITVRGMLGGQDHKFLDYNWGEALVVDCNDLGLGPNLVDLTLVELQTTAISNLPPSLTRLEISDNRLVQIDELPAQLRTLDLSFNYLARIELGGSLVDVNLCRNNLASVTNFPSSIKVLNLSHNKLELLLGLPASLEVLDLSHNQFTETELELPLVHTINLRNNKLHSFLGRLPQLDVIDLSCNLFQAVPSFASDQLSVLKLEHNMITDCAALAHYPHLYTLNLSLNSLPCIPEDVTQLLELVELEVESNLITEWTKIAMPSLTLINLGSNQLTEVDFAELALKNVNLAHNRLTRFAVPTTTTVLDLSRNLLTEIPRFTDFTNLVLLDVSSNKLVLVDVEAPNLDRLVLWGNPVENVVVNDNHIPDIRFGSEHIKTIGTPQRQVFVHPSDAETNWRNDLRFSNRSLYIPGGIAVGMRSLPPNLKELDVLIREESDLSAWTLPPKIELVQLTRKVDTRYPKVRFNSTELVKPPGGNHCFANLNHLTYLLILGLNVKMSPEEPMVCPMLLKYLNFDNNVSEEIWFVFNGRGPTSLFSLSIKLCFADSERLSKYTYDSIGHNETTQHDKLRVILALCPPIIDDLGVDAYINHQLCADAEISMVQTEPVTYQWPTKVINAVFDPAVCPARLQGIVNDRYFGGIKKLSSNLQGGDVLYWEYANPHRFDLSQPVLALTRQVRYI